METKECSVCCLSVERLVESQSKRQSIRAAMSIRVNDSDLILVKNPDH